MLAASFVVFASFGGQIAQLAASFLNLHLIHLVFEVKFLARQWLQFVRVWLIY